MDVFCEQIGLHHVSEKVEVSYRLPGPVPLDNSPCQRSDLPDAVLLAVSR